jgi:phosphoribosylformimino-5-aminoimidazole carboxamide ribonucleotide (ProFAR) isomerase
MAFEILPGIDVLGGRLARLAGGVVEPVDAYQGDPIAAAAAFRAAGAAWIHLVDLDLAFEGRLTVGPIVEGLAAMGLRVQVSGAVRATDPIVRLLGSGATRVVLGSAALVDGSFVVESISRFGASLWCGIEAEDDRIRSRGVDPVELPLVPTLGWLTTAGAHGFVATAVARVSGLAGPDPALVRRIARSGRPVVAGGGIASVDDLRAVRAAGASGAIVGRAALEGTLDLAEAFRSLG